MTFDWVEILRLKRYLALFAGWFALISWYYILPSRKIILESGTARMPMIKKSISVTVKQDEWIKSQIASGNFGNESEIIRELIRERQLREEETPAEIRSIRSALAEGEKSGLSKRSAEQIIQDVMDRKRANGSI